MRLIAAIVVFALYAAGSITPKRTKVSYGRNPIMRQRNEIVRDVLLAHPTWTSAAVFRAVAPLIAAAGIAPISYENLDPFPGRPAD